MSPPRAGGPIPGLIDCSVHHDWTTEGELLPYLPTGARQIHDSKGESDLLAMSSGFLSPRIARESKLGTYSAVQQHVFDEGGAARAVLVYGKGLNLGGLRDGHFAHELARAANDWTVAEWLSRDQRLAGSILVASQLPESAASEVRRFASTPQMCQVMMAGNGIGKPFGHPVYHPIYEAAAESGKPIAIHAGAAGGLNPSTAAGGAINLFIEYHVLAMQGLMTHIASFIAHGVFEKYPGLRLVLLGGGVSWLPSFMWRFDSDFKGVRREVPWVRALPSEYLRERIVIATQPFDGPPDPSQFGKFLGLLPPNTTLIYGSGFPGWDENEPSQVADFFPESWRDDVMGGNASRLYDWFGAE